MNTFRFLLREAWNNLRRHRLMTLAAMTTIAVSLALGGAFALAFYQMNAAASHATKSFEMRVFCRADLGADGLAALQKRLEAAPGVARVAFKSRDEIWREQARESALDLSGVPNLMPDTFVVTLALPDNAPVLARTVRAWSPDVDGVDLPEKEIGGVLRLVRFARTLGYGMGALLLAGAVVVVSNTIRISVFARRREIRIMQIVGASPWFIRLPLVLEGLIHGAVGAVGAGVCLLVWGRAAADLAHQSAPLLLPYGAPVSVPLVGACLLLVGATLGAGGALLSIHRYLKAT